MNPKDMTKSDLLVELVNRTKGYGFLNDPKPVISELLRRLDSADALRKENEELRKDKERLDWLDERVSWEYDERRATSTGGNNTLRNAIDADIAKETK